MTKLPTAEEIYVALAENGDNKTAAARQLGIHRQTLRELMVRLGMSTKPTTGGDVASRPLNKMLLPEQGKIKVYILTSAQNNTKVHKRFLDNLVIYRDYRMKDDRVESAALMISRFTYNKTAFNNDWMVKPGTEPVGDDHGKVFYDPAISEYVCDDPALHGSCRYELAPDLWWCAEANILPTAVNPLSGRDSYAGTASAIFPHAKIALKSCDRMFEESPRIVLTTGACTQLNYIQRNAGQKAEFHHTYGAVVVEVNSDGHWWVRHINADRYGSFYDCPGGTVVYLSKNSDLTEGHATEAINWGDVHASEIDPIVEEVNWGVGGALDTLRPKHQLLHDFLSFRSQSHHERTKFGKRYLKWLRGKDIVEDEIVTTYNLLQKVHRPWCKTVVVNSNHDRHPDRWLDEADYKADLPNAKFFLRMQLARVIAMETGDHWDFFKTCMQYLGDTKTRFLKKGESYKIGPAHHLVECGLHGDAGPNGARGSTRNLARMGNRINKGHDHAATILDGACSAGACQLNLDYNEGDPTNWSISHILTYNNGKRTILTQRAGRLWA